MSLDPRNGQMEPNPATEHGKIVREIMGRGKLSYTQAQGFLYQDVATWKSRLDVYEKGVQQRTPPAVHTREQVICIKKIRETLHSSLKEASGFYFSDPSTWEVRLAEALKPKSENSWTSEEFERLINNILDDRAKIHSNSSVEATEADLDAFDKIRETVNMFREHRNRSRG